MSMREAIVKFWPKSLSTQITPRDLENEDRGAAFVQKVDEELEKGIIPGVQMEVDGVNTRDLQGRVTLLCTPDALNISIVGDQLTDERIAQIEDVVTRHLQRFSARDPLNVHWVRSAQ